VPSLSSADLADFHVIGVSDSAILQLFYLIPNKKDNKTNFTLILFIVYGRIPYIFAKLIQKFMASQSYKKGQTLTLLTKIGKDFVHKDILTPSGPFNEYVPKTLVTVDVSHWDVLKDFTLTVSDFNYIEDENAQKYPSIVGTRPSNIFVRRR
jgi:hypothetical protein